MSRPSDKDEYNFVVAECGQFARQWEWEMFRNGRPLPIRLREGNFSRRARPRQPERLRSANSYKPSIATKSLTCPNGAASGKWCCVPRERETAPLEDIRWCDMLLRRSTVPSGSRLPRIHARNDRQSKRSFSRCEAQGTPSEAVEMGNLSRRQIKPGSTVVGLL
jgi:hypothetical protein